MQSKYSALRRPVSQNAERLVAKYRASSLSQSQFAERHGIKLSTLRQWLYRPGSQRRVGRPRPAFQEVALSGVLFPGHWAAEVRLPGGAVLRVNGQAQVEWVGALVERLS